MLIKLLKGQCGLIKNINVDNRIDATLLTDLFVQGQSANISPELEQEIKQLTACLKWGNAEAHIRSTFWKLGAPERIDKGFLEAMYTKLIGKMNQDGTDRVTYTMSRSKNGVLTYPDVERCLLRAMVEVSHSLPPLSAEQQELIGKSLIDPLLDNSAKETIKEEEDDEVNEDAPGSAGGAGSNAQGKSSSKKTSSGSVKHGDGSTKRNFIKENALKASLHSNARGHNADHRGGEVGSDKAHSEDGQPRSASNEGQEGTLNSPPIVDKRISNVVPANAGNGVVLHYKDLQNSGAQEGNSSPNTRSVTHADVTDISTQPHLSSQQRSSGYNKLQGSPTGHTARKRQSLAVFNSPLPSSPPVSPVIRPQAAVESEARNSSLGGVRKQAGKGKANKSMYIQHNIQHIQELQNALKLEAETGIPAKKLMATTASAAGTRNKRSSSAGAMVSTTNRLDVLALDGTKNSVASRTLEEVADPKKVPSNGSSGSSSGEVTELN